MAVEEIGLDIYRISTYIPDFNLQFNQFLFKDDEPLLFHTGMKGLFPAVRKEVARIIDPASISWIGFSHFEADECGALNEWLEIATRAETVCSFVGAVTSINDFAVRPARGMQDGESFETGRFKFRFVNTPHVPHCWDAGMLFEETDKTLLCSDLFTHSGDVEAHTSSDIVGRFKEDLIAGESTPFAGAYPFSEKTEYQLDRLAALEPATIAVMHGSSFSGNGKKAVEDMKSAMKDVLGDQRYS
ncbi:MAG: hypothetical protein R2681_00260 [Pyrinomonadaceae bacterium]